MHTCSDTTHYPICYTLVMNKTLLVALLSAMIFGGVYWYSVVGAICNVPITYRIGTIDPSFNLSTDEARNLASSAESLWEDRTGQNLFTYSDTGKVAINFIFDDRQKQTIEEGKLRHELESKENLNDSIKSQYEELLSRYHSLTEEYDVHANAYETTLKAHNAEVSDWNTRGGAPSDVYARLQKEEHDLAKEQTVLHKEALSINTIAKQLNTISAQGNSIITDYNKTVARYNDTFSEGHEFTQGDYNKKERTINIYQYETEDELVIVLAHEMGHALSIGHVEDERSIMYRLMGKQSKESGLTEEDLDGFNRICGEGSTIPSIILNVFKELRV